MLKMIFSSTQPDYTIQICLCKYYTYSGHLRAISQLLQKKPNTWNLLSLLHLVIGMREPSVFAKYFVPITYSTCTTKL